MHPLFVFLFIFGHVAHKILIHPSVIKLMSSAMEILTLNHWTTRDVQVIDFLEILSLNQGKLGHNCIMK